MAVAWVPLIEFDRCPPGRGTFIEFAGRELAVFRIPDPPHVAVIDNTCPHAGGNLAGGKIDGHVVTCPWHDWPFDVTTGRCTLSPVAAVRCYAAEVRDGWVRVQMPGTEQRTTT